MRAIRVTFESKVLGREIAPLAYVLQDKLVYPSVVFPVGRTYPYKFPVSYLSEYMLDIFVAPFDDIPDKQLIGAQHEHDIIRAVFFQEACRYCHTILMWRCTILQPEVYAHYALHSLAYGASILRALSRQ